MILDLITMLVILAWFSPFFYLSLTLSGKYFHSKNQKRFAGKRDVDIAIFQIPTIGNVKTVNTILGKVRDYSLPVKLETWVLIEENNPHVDEYCADRVVVIPVSFECEDLYKARALEYARRLRIKMVKTGELSNKYVVYQCDDDSLPSKEFLIESLNLKVDLMIGHIVPKYERILQILLDYERPIACVMFCSAFSNANTPVWAHGEGMAIGSYLDQNLSYDVSEVCDYDGSFKLISSEDLFYFHKASSKGYSIYNSDNPVYVVSPFSFRDAIIQRRRWMWGHVNILKRKLIPYKNLIRLAVVEYLGLGVYAFSLIGMPLHWLGIIEVPISLQFFSLLTLAIWMGLRGYAVRKYMGWKHGVFAGLMGYITVTLNFMVHTIGLLKGDPKRFEVIKKERS